MPLPRHSGTGPCRQEQGTIDHTMGVGSERLRHKLRRKNGQNASPESTVKRRVPVAHIPSYLDLPDTHMKIEHWYREALKLELKPR